MIKVEALTKLSNSFVLHLGILFCAVVVLAGKKPPFENEYIYLLRLVKTYNSDFLLNDALFGIPANEHWLFNHLFGVFTLLFSIEIIGWGGRILCWTLLLYALMRLARHWEVSLWMITVSIILWLAQGQSIVGKEWIIGSFEAKCVAYICLLFALDGFSRDKLIYPAILLGLTFSFHPVVGMWANLAVGLALLTSRWDLRKIVKVAAISLVFALPGLVPFLSGEAIKTSVEDWKFIELARFPHIFDPFSWSKSSILLVYVQLLFCLILSRGKSGESRLRFLSGFLAALGLFFTAGFVLRGFDQYELLRFMPMRLFPVFVSLFFFLSIANVHKQQRFSAPIRGVVMIALALILVWQNPIASAIVLTRDTYQSWRSRPDDIANSFLWLRENTPNGTIVIAPPWRQDSWYLSQRAQVGSAGFPTYSDLGEWRVRVETLSGESLLNRTDRENDQRPAFYYSIGAEEMNKIAERYGAKYLVSESDYPFRVVFSSGKSKVYSFE